MTVQVPKGSAQNSRVARRRLESGQQPALPVTSPPSAHTADRGRRPSKIANGSPPGCPQRERVPIPQHVPPGPQLGIGTTSSPTVPRLRHDLARALDAFSCGRRHSQAPASQKLTSEFATGVGRARDLIPAQIWLDTRRQKVLENSGAIFPG